MTTAAAVRISAAAEAVRDIFSWSVDGKIACGITTYGKAIFVTGRDAAQRTDVRDG